MLIILAATAALIIIPLALLPLVCGRIAQATWDRLTRPPRPKR